MRPALSATTMFCIGATQPLAASMNDATSVARFIASATPTLSMSGSSAVQRIANT